MFTGIIIDVGTVVRVNTKDEDITVGFQLNNLSVEKLIVGDSVSVNGVCLTITNFENDIFFADISKETIKCTTLGTLKIDSKVNLEPAITPSTALGGHIVSGHIDNIGKINSYSDNGRSIEYEVELPKELAKYVVPKGSITIDGVSLTVNSIRSNIFNVNIIPHTQKQTIFGTYTENTLVNIEVDVIARYLEKLIIN